MNLKQYRKSLGLTQEQAGGRLGISKQSWYSLEKNWPNIETNSMLALVEHLDAKITIDFPGGARLVEHIPEPDEHTQEDLASALDYLPTVLSKADAKKFTEHQSDPNRHPFTCCSPDYIERCTRATGQSDGVLALDEDGIARCPCGEYYQNEFPSIGIHD